jgi:ABC-type glycerol-3-phosphate transport system substrate-binding protein
MNNFQTILVAVFLAFFVFGVMIFSGLIDFGSKTKSNNISGEIIVWGTLPSSQISELLFNNLPGSGDAFSVTYVEKKVDELDQDLIEAYAKDKGPDLFILPSDMVLKNNNFIYKIPYTSYSEKTFRNSFIDGADIYLSKDGVLGFPLLVDPLVLYYNKDMLTNESILYPPATWDELFSLNPKLTKKDKDGKIINSMIALGQYDNVNHVKDILSMFLLQSNNPIIIPIDKGYRLAFKDVSTDGISPINQIVNFFLEFSNPSKESYSWNRSQPSSFDMFTSGKLAFYIGYASELFKIESVNPNLSYDVTMIPQTKGANLKRTYGNIYTIFISNKSKNLTSSSGVASLIKDSSFLKELGIATSLPTATRSLLADKPTDPYIATFFDGAIISRSWFDPDNKQTDQIFKELIENSISNRLSVGSAIDKASNQLTLLLKKIYE